MQFKIKKSNLRGQIRIPGSKSHTIRGLILGLLAHGQSNLREPLDSSDTRSCLKLVRSLGAAVDDSDPSVWKITGTNRQPVASEQTVDIGNSGTTLFLGMGAAALANGLTELTGDDQIQRRSGALLLEALSSLGATAYSKKKNGCAPLIVGGGLNGGEVEIECPTSQYMSSLLIACPAAENESCVNTPLLHEKPYVEMTRRWVESVGIELEASEDLQNFRIPGKQKYRAFDKTVPADFSSATFFLVAAAITGSELVLEGLDMNDSQGDKAVVSMMAEMGCRVDASERTIRIQGPERLQGVTFDLNATPDALPALAVAGTLADGETRLINVPQARMKETDRIAVMTAELRKMGATIEELEDGLVIEGDSLAGNVVDGHADHRVVMALAVAGLAASGQTTVKTAEAVSITFPEFADLMREIGARIQTE
ncbi:MAG: 3-phosphoshikimate 1-carboxyvinyltransferase [Candidatus Brocadiia bacterium]